MAKTAKMAAHNAAICSTTLHTEARKYCPQNFGGTPARYGGTRKYFFNIYPLTPRNTRSGFSSEILKIAQNLDLDFLDFQRWLHSTQPPFVGLYTTQNMPQTPIPDHSPPRGPGKRRVEIRLTKSPFVVFLHRPACSATGTKLANCRNLKNMAPIIGATWAAPRHTFLCICATFSPCGDVDHI